VVDQVTRTAVERFGGVDVLVNNAGIMDRMSALADVSDAEWERVLRVNLTAPFLLTRAVLPHMLAAGKGAIVNTASEAGLRGSRELNIGTLGWKIGGFRATNYDDIVAVPAVGRTGFGYFSNVGRTRRQGLEAEVNIKSPTLQFQASYAFVDARYLDAFALGSESPFRDIVTETIQVLPGNQLPAIPRHRVKVGVDYAITDVWKVGGNALFVSSQYLVGDESNQYAKLPSYTVFNLHTSYQVTKNFQLYGKIDNIFDKRYATYGQFFDREAVPNFTNGGAEFTDPRSLSPARPRAFYAGMRVTF
jgi:outer membrane receptor protein involved in Fe transport